MKKIEITQTDLFYLRALELLLEEGHLKVHDLDRSELMRTAKVLEWVKQYTQKMQIAYDKPIESTPLPALPVNPKSPKRGSKK